MPFPDAARVIYDLNPLDEVICQLRFPPILKIEAESPAGFQEEIRAEYPNYEAKSPIRIGGTLPPQLAELFETDVPLVGRQSHEFVSRDEVWKLSLTRQFIALTCKRYNRWEEFRERLEAGLAALQGHFRPAYFNRIGLRYKDAIKPSTLGLEGTPWSELLRPEVLGLLGSPEVAESVGGVQSASLVNLSNNIGQAQFRFALAEHGDTQKPVFLIDGDFFTDKQTEPENVLTCLDTFNKKAGLFFHWCIRPKLHNAMRPKPVPPVPS